MEIKLPTKLASGSKRGSLFTKCETPKKKSVLAADLSIMSDHFQFPTSENPEKKPVAEKDSHKSKPFCLLESEFYYPLKAPGGILNKELLNTSWEGMSVVSFLGVP